MSWGCSSAVWWRQGVDRCCDGRARSLDNSECAFRSEDFAPNRFAYQREAASVLMTGARLRGAGGAPGPGAFGREGPSDTVARFAVVLAGGAPRVLAPLGHAEGASLAALSVVEPDERSGGFLAGLRLAAVRLRPLHLFLGLLGANVVELIKATGTCSQVLRQLSQRAMLRPGGLRTSW